MPRIRRIPIRYYAGENLIEIEPNLGEVFDAYARLLSTRYQESSKTDYKSEETIEDKRMGVVGQKFFESLLVQWQVPFIPIDPLWLFKQHRPFLWDFFVPGFGSIEVKTTRPNYRYFGIKKSLWDIEVQSNPPPEWVTALRLVDQSHAEIMGWLKGDEVTKLEIFPKGHPIAPFADMYGCQFGKLHPFSEIKARLRACSILKDGNQD